jgi:hypothetical protein
MARDDDEALAQEREWQAIVENFGERAVLRPEDEAPEVVAPTPRPEPYDAASDDPPEERDAVPADEMEELRVAQCPSCGAEIEFDEVRVQARKRDRPEIEELTGQRDVPVLVHGDEVIHDSRRILEYVEYVSGGPEAARAG